MESYTYCIQCHQQVCTLQLPIHLQWHALRDSASADGSTRVPLLADSTPSMRAVRSKPCGPLFRNLHDRSGHEAIEVHYSGRAGHAVGSDAHSRRDALAYVVWHRAHAHWSVPVSAFVSAFEDRHRATSRKSARGQGRDTSRCSFGSDITTLAADPSGKYLYVGPTARLMKVVARWSSKGFHHSKCSLLPGGRVSASLRSRLP